MLAFVSYLCLKCREIDPNAFVLEISTTIGPNFSPVSFTISQSHSIASGKSIVTLTFSGSGIVGGSLPDGNYRLTALSSKIRGVAADDALPLNGDYDQFAGGDFVDSQTASDSFFRLFGDSDGNGLVNPLETNRYRGTVGKSSGDPGFDSRFDYDANGARV